MAKGDLRAASPSSHGESPPQGHRPKCLRVADAVLGSCHPVQTAFTARRGPRGHCVAQGRGRGAVGRRIVSLNLPALCLKGASPDGSQVTGHGCEGSTQPVPLGLPPRPQPAVGTRAPVTAPAGSHAERTSVGSRTAGGAPAGCRVMGRAGCPALTAAGGCLLRAAGGAGHAAERWTRSG